MNNGDDTNYMTNQNKTSFFKPILALILFILLILFQWIVISSTPIVIGNILPVNTSYFLIASPDKYLQDFRPTVNVEFDILGASVNASEKQALALIPLEVVEDNENYVSLKLKLLVSHVTFYRTHNIEVRFYGPHNTPLYGYPNVSIHEVAGTRTLRLDQIPISIRQNITNNVARYNITIPTCSSIIIHFDSLVTCEKCPQSRMPMELYNPQYNFKVNWIIDQVYILIFKQQQTSNLPDYQLKLPLCQINYNFLPYVAKPVFPFSDCSKHYPLNITQVPVKEIIITLKIPKEYEVTLNGQWKLLKMHFNVKINGTPLKFQKTMHSWRGNLGYIIEENSIGVFKPSINQSIYKYTILALILLVISVFSAPVKTFREFSEGIYGKHYSDGFIVMYVVTTLISLLIFSWKLPVIITLILVMSTIITKSKYQKVAYILCISCTLIYGIISTIDVLSNRIIISLSSSNSLIITKIMTMLFVWSLLVTYLIICHHLRVQK